MRNIHLLCKGQVPLRAWARGNAGGGLPVVVVVVVVIYPTQLPLRPGISLVPCGVAVGPAGSGSGAGWGRGRGVCQGEVIKRSPSALPLREDVTLILRLVALAVQETGSGGEGLA